MSNEAGASSDCVLMTVITDVWQHGSKRHWCDTPWTNAIITVGRIDLRNDSHCQWEKGEKKVGMLLLFPSVNSEVQSWMEQHAMLWKDNTLTPGTMQAECRVPSTGHKLTVHLCVERLRTFVSEESTNQSLWHEHLWNKCYFHTTNKKILFTDISLMACRGISKMMEFTSWHQSSKWQCFYLRRVFFNFVESPDA